MISPEILYEDRHCLVAVKPVGVPTQKGRRGDGDMVSLLERERKGTVGSLYLLHRLDREVGGVMLFAKTHGDASFFASAIEKRNVRKEYLAVVQGRPEAETGEWRDFLFRDEDRRKTVTVAPTHRGAKEAILRYTLLQSAEREEGTVSLLRIELLTGRNHQIRVQCAAHRLPLCGDTRYGTATGEERPALFAWRLTFPEPEGGFRTASRLPQGEVWDAFPLSDLLK